MFRFARQLLFAVKPEEAKVETEISVNILESSLGTDHDFTRDAMQSLCEIMDSSGEAELADELAQKLFATIAKHEAMELRKRLFGIPSLANLLFPARQMNGTLGNLSPIVPE